jgi:hypothetical protein
MQSFYSDNDSLGHVFIRLGMMLLVSLVQAEYIQFILYSCLAALSKEVLLPQGEKESAIILAMEGLCAIV